MIGPGGLKSASALVEHALRPMMMNIVQGEHRDPAMAMLGMVPSEERSAEGNNGFATSATRCLNVRIEPDPDFELSKYAERSFGAYQELAFDVASRFDADLAQDAATFLFHPS